MTSKPRVLRKIIYVDARKCNGCGDCIPACSQAALAVVDGTASLSDDRYCDGGGACLFHCPTGALSLEQRWAEEFDQTAVKEHIKSTHPLARHYRNSRDE